MNNERLKFRDSAIESRRAQSRFDPLVTLNPPIASIGLTAVYVLLGVTLVWGFLGEIPTNIRGEGVLLVEDGAIYSAVAPEGSGRVVAVTVLPGDDVRKGDVIAELDPENLRQQIDSSLHQVEQLTESLERLKRDADVEIARRADLFREQNDLLQNVITVETANLKNLTELVNIKKSAWERGVETRESVVQATSEQLRSETEISRATDRAKQLEIEFAEYRERWQERVREFELRLEEAKQRLAELESRLAHARFVSSPVDGVVTSVQTSVGHMARGGTAVATLASIGRGMDALVFMPPEDGKRVSPGMRALVVPSTIKPEEFGSIVGEVVTVSQFPVSREAMSAILQNPNLVEYFLKRGPPITVRIRLVEDASTFSGLAWTSSKGPNQSVSPGSIANAEITVRRQSPMSLLVPSLGRLFGE